MLPAAVAALLVGCRFEPSGAIPDDGAPPVPPDVAVDAPPPDAAPPDANTDQDGDTIRDMDDNCPNVANPEQEDCDGDDIGDACDIKADGPDADGDLVSDVCDNCPTVANLDQLAARDDDEVGDACDPQPDQDGDTIAYFSGFDGDSGDEPGGWSLATGVGLVDAQWRVEDGKLVHDANAEASILYLSGQTVPANVIVEAKFSVSDFVSGGSEPLAFIGLLTRYTNGLAGGGADVGYLCQLEQGIDGEPAARVLIQDLAGTMTGTDVAPWGGALQESYTIEQQQNGIISRCTVTPSMVELRESVRLDNIPGPATGSIAIRTQRISAAFDYIVVYGLGTAPPASITASPSAYHPAP